MPSSDSEQRYGTIFMGPTQDRETTLDRLYDVAQRDIWNKRTEDEYMERIKDRATERVRALLLQARKRGDEILTQAESRAGAMQAEGEATRVAARAVREEADKFLADAQTVREEADALREAARQQGFNAGHAEAMDQLAETRKALAETTGAVLIGIHEQCGHIFEAWRDDLADLLREAVEKTTGWVADHDRAVMLKSLLDQSMRAMLDRRHFIVRVHPTDAALLTDMLADAHKANPRTADWELATDPGLEPGSLVVESDAALVDNSRGARRSVVDEVLEHLSLPMGAADEAAFAEVTRTLVSELHKQGVDLEEAGEAPAPAGEEEETASPQMVENASAPAFLEEPEPLGADTVVPESAENENPVADMPPSAAELGPEIRVEAESVAPAVSPEVMKADAEAQDLVREFLADDLLDDTPAGSPDMQPDMQKGANFAPPGAPSPHVPPPHDDSASLANEADAGLPSDVADALLAEMGFGPNSAPDKNA